MTKESIPTPHLRVVNLDQRLRDALMLLWLHDVIPDAEFEKAKKRLNKRALTKPSSK